MWTARSDGRAFLALALGLVALAWLGIVVWGASPYGSYLHHNALASVRDPLSRAFAYRVLLFAGGWSLMTVAMMLPTSLPLVSLFQTMTRARPNRRLLTCLLIAGYLVVWLAFGVLAYAFDLGVHTGVGAIGWLSARAWLISAMVLMGAGAYQFTPFKYYCLDKCRSPYMFVMGHWHGQNARGDAFRLGIAHGLFCVGCCWSIMLLMFAIGMGNLAWMAGLAVVMGVEKNLPWGRKLTPALGTVLITAGVTLLIVGGPATACAC